MYSHRHMNSNKTIYGFGKENTEYTTCAKGSILYVLPATRLGQMFMKQEDF